MLINYWQRLLGVFLYMLPWSEAIPFGRYLFIQFPFLQFFTIPALPLIIIQQIIPFGSLLLFILLFFLVIRNPKVSYFLRFNALQSILINIALIIIKYGFQILLIPFGSSLLIQTFSSIVLIGMLCLIIFASYECSQGREPDLPGFSEAVRIQL